MEEKKITAEDILKSVEKIRTEPFGVEDRRVVVRYDDLCAVIDRLQTENETLKSNKFASWKIKFFNLKEEFDKELEEHKEFTKKANAEIERLKEEKKTLVWLNQDLKKQVDELKEERENMSDEIFSLETMLQEERIEKKSLRDAFLQVEKQAVKGTAEKFAERVKMAFYYEFDELIPSIMSDKIGEIAKEITEGKE